MYALMCEQRPAQPQPGGRAQAAPQRPRRSRRCSLRRRRVHASRQGSTRLPRAALSPGPRPPGPATAVPDPPPSSKYRRPGNRRGQPQAASRAGTHNELLPRRARSSPLRNTASTATGKRVHEPRASPRAPTATCTAAERARGEWGQAGRGRATPRKTRCSPPEGGWKRDTEDTHWTREGGHREDTPQRGTQATRA